MPSDAEIKEVMQEVFPFKKSGYRENQETAILKVVKTFFAGRKFCIVEAPTGVGKSVLAYAAIKTIQHFDSGFRVNEETDEKYKAYAGPYGLISVHTRALQQQYSNTFPDVPLIWSGSNYECAVEPKNPDMYWGCGACLKKKCVKYDFCDYKNALEEFMQADIGITNYAYYLHAPFLFPFISVIDECHNLEDVLCEWSKVELSTKYLTQTLLRLLKLQTISEDDADSIQRNVRAMININDEKAGWLEELRELSGETVNLVFPLHKVLEKEMREIKKGLSDPNAISKGDKHHLDFLERASRYFRNMGQKLLPIRTLETDWVISNIVEEENTENKVYPRVEIKPLYINEVSHQKLFDNSQFFLFMSATVCGPDIFMKYLGIEKNKAMYFQLPSMFPADNRPVGVFTDVGTFVHKNRDAMRVRFTNWLDHILTEQFPDVRGVVHSVSYENSEFIQKNSQCLDRMIFPDSEDLLEIIPLLETKHNTVVVSPSVVEGLDLKDDLCRFAIFLKVPWQSLGDKWIKARSDRDSAWYARGAIIKIIQGSGRGTRTETDHSMTLMFDNVFLRLWKNNREFFPKWYADAITFLTKNGEVVEIEGIK